MMLKRIQKPIINHHSHFKSSLPKLEGELDMKRLKNLILVILLFTIASVSPVWSGTTGKINGVITDKATGDPLPGANVIVIGTTLGAATDLNGEYTILKVPPGNYDVKISSIGYQNVIIKDVVVNIDQTTRLNVSMTSETIEVGEVVVTAEKHLIKPDVATSVVAIDDKQIRELPVTNIAGVLGLQAGVSGGGNYINIRGGGPEGVLVQVNGITLRDPRDQSIDLQLPLSSLKEVSIERGGFNAEYGQVQSGIVNVITREGKKDSYSARFQFRVNPPQEKYWLAPGVTDLNNPMSYALRPFFDPAVAWTGTGTSVEDGGWDYYTRSKYPAFQGWDAISQQLNAQGVNLTPAAAQRAFEYEIRKKQPNNQPDFDIDAGFGGPVPFVSDALGNLRFYASYKGSRTMLIWPLARPDYRFNEATLQLNTDITPSMKLQFYGLYGDQLTERANWSSTNLELPIDVLSNGLVMGHQSSVDLIQLYSDFYFVPANIWHNHFSAKFTHTLNSSTFYEVSVQNTYYNYTLTPGALRDTTQKVELVPGFYEDSNPFGYYPYDNNGILINGGQNFARSRDYTHVNSTEIKADLVSQVNFENLVKFGISFSYNDLNFDYGIVSSQTSGDDYASRTQMRVFPYRGAIYLQDKLEAKEFTLNAGLRLDYADANVHWWDLDPFNSSFFSTSFNSSESFPTTESKMQWFLSPRLGVAHPITENAKLFFNYGWFRELPQYENMFWLNRSSLNAVTYMGNPNITMQRTISYELGVDYSFSDEYLLQIAGYYKDATDQRSDLYYYGTAAGFNYQAVGTNNYGDHRGAEFTLRKTVGSWFRGFINYTYDVGSTGHFGSQNIYDNISDQTSYDQATKNLYQDRPIPQPYARANLNFYTPSDFGPEFLNNNIFGDWMLNIVADWRAGQWQTYNESGQLNISYNVQAVDYFNTNLRLQKTIDLGKFSVNLFMDMNNVFNTRYLTDAASNPGYLVGNVNYMRSLHLPASDAYDNIPGDDKIGDYREPGVAWQPIERQSIVSITSDPPSADYMNGNNSIAIYYSLTSKDYWWYRDGAWSKVPQSKMDQVLKDKAYINMPNESTFWFLNPRQIFFGITVSFNFD